MLERGNSLLIKKNDIFYDKVKLSFADIERQFLLFLCTLKYEGQEMWMFLSDLSMPEK